MSWLTFYTQSKNSIPSLYLFYLKCDSWNGIHDPVITSSVRSADRVSNRIQWIVIKMVYIQTRYRVLWLSQRIPILNSLKLKHRWFLNILTLLLHSSTLVQSVDVNGIQIQWIEWSELNEVFDCVVSMGIFLSTVFLYCTETQRKYWVPTRVIPQLFVSAHNVL